MFDAIRRIPDYDALPTVPSVDEWRAMTPEARMKFQVEVNTALTPPAHLMSEGQPHTRAKSRIMDALGLHFKAIGRIVYLADELSVLYPKEKPFSPDILAVLDVKPSDNNDERMSWVVADEGKGIDLALEVLHRGDRDKDLVDNVERYARLGINEYFVYDRARQRIHGYRLAMPNAGRYQPIIPQLGHYHSSVLGLDLAIIEDQLRFLAGEAALPQSVELIRRLQGMVTSLESKADDAQAKIDQARADADQARADADQARADADQAQAKIDQAQAKVDQASAGLREALLLILDMRGIVCPDESRTQIAVCQDPISLRRWISLARTATNIQDVLDTDS